MKSIVLLFNQPERQLSNAHAYRCISKHIFSQATTDQLQKRLGGKTYVEKFDLCVVKLSM